MTRRGKRKRKKKRNRRIEEESIEDTMSYEELKDGAVVKMMVSVNNDWNKLVAIEKNGKENRKTSQRVKPVIWFNRGKWRTIPDVVIRNFKLHGYYLVAVPWTLKGPQIIDKERVNGGQYHVLHCVRKEHPNIKFRGKVGPISSFVPRLNDKGKMVMGFYVGYHWDGKESLEEIPDHFEGKLTLRGRKYVHPGADSSSAVKRLGVIVGCSGYCVGMEVRLTREEENNKRRKGEYHHTRPILMENCFYVFDGVFTWQPILSNLEHPIPLPTDIASPLMFLGEGIHLITSTKDNRSTDGEKYRRCVEICPSAESDMVSIVDWDRFEKDFFT